MPDGSIFNILKPNGYVPTILKEILNKFVENYHIVLIYHTLPFAIMMAHVALMCRQGECKCAS